VRLKYVGLVLAGASLTLMSTGCVSMLAKMALNMATSKTNDLSLCALQSRYVTNLFPKDAQTFEMAQYTSNWTEGAGVVMVNCFARNGGSIYELEGSVLVDGQPMEYVAGGSYTKLVPAGDTKPKTITITTTSGQKTSFTVKPAQPVQLVAVNGKKGGSNVDVTQDMTLEFADVGADAGYVRVGLITDTSGMRNFSDIGVYKLDKKVQVPAAAFRHPSLFKTSSINVNGKRGALSTSTKLVTGANYIFVERYEVTPIKAEGASAVENFGLAWSWLPVTIKGNSEVNPGISFSKTMNTDSGGVDYSITKPAAVAGKPLAKAKKFALVSMSLDGNLEAITDATKYEMGTGAVTKNATGSEERLYHVWKFPQVPLNYWDAEMERFYGEFTAAFEKDFGISFIPTEDVVKAAAYKELAAFEEVSSAQKISHSFRGLKTFTGPRVGTATVSSDKSEIQLMRELGVDGLVVVNLAVSMPTEGVTRENCEGLGVTLPQSSGLSTNVHCRRGELSLKTKASFRIVGMPKAYGPLLSTYAEGELSTVKGIPYGIDEFKDAAALGRVVRSNDLVNALKTALREQESKAKDLGYHVMWDNAPQSSNPGT